MSGDKKGFFKSVSKQLGRQQERLRHKLKGDDYNDEEFQEHVANFNSQSAHAHRLLKESQHFLKALKAMEGASRSFCEAIKIAYDPDWEQSNEVYGNIDAIGQLYEDFESKIQDEVIAPLQGYVARFPELKARVSKRERRLLTYERAKRALDHARQKDAQVAKLQQAEASFHEAEEQFTEVDDECKQTLPSFYSGRISIVGSILQGTFSHQSVFHGACQSLFNELCGSVDAALDAHAGQDPVRTADDKQQSYPDQNMEGMSQRLEKAASVALDDSIPSLLKTEAPQPPDDDDDDGGDGSDTQANANGLSEDQDGSHSSSNVNKSAESRISDEAKVGSDVLEVRIATHAYVGQDEDELTFNPGATVHVIPFADPDDAEDGWLYGRCNGKEGLFPANHTDPADA